MWTPFEMCVRSSLSLSLVEWRVKIGASLLLQMDKQRCVLFEILIQLHPIYTNFIATEIEILLWKCQTLFFFVWIDWMWAVTTLGCSHTAYWSRILYMYHLGACRVQTLAYNRTAASSAAYIINLIEMSMEKTVNMLWTSIARIKRLVCCCVIALRMPQFHLNNSNYSHRTLADAKFFFSVQHSASSARSSSFAFSTSISWNN